MKFGRLLALLQCFVLLAALLGTPASAANSAYEFEDGNRMSDEEFFGKWTDETWEIEPKLDYAYAGGLGYVEEYVKAGDYDNAKESLLHYYKNRDLQFSLPTGRSPVLARVYMEGIRIFETAALGILSLGTQPESYSVNVTSQVKNNINCFLLESLKRESTEDNMETIVHFNAKESGANAPVLEVTQGSTVTRIPVQEDMYIRGGDFAGENYGTEAELLVSEGGNGPSSNGTRQAHIKFDISGLDSGKEITKATLRLYGYSEAEAKEVVVFSGVENTWDETAVSYASLPIRVMNWNNLEGGYDWSQPEYAHVQFYNVQIRLGHITTMFSEYYATKNETYAVAAINEYLDFIKDNGGLLYDTYVKEAALNAGFRGDSASILGFFGTLHADGIVNGDAITSIAKLLYQEAVGLTIPKNEWRKHNGQAFQIESLIRLIAYFPEFRERDSWIESFQRRVVELTDDLLFEDGGYTEATSGYDAGVFTTFVSLYDLADIAGVSMPEAFDEAYHKFAVAEMNLTMPDGVQWGWGDGGPTAMRDRVKAAAEKLGDDELLYFGTNGAEGKLPGYTSFFLPESKLGVMRNNWTDDAVSAFLIGRTGGGHGHADVNNMSMYAYGRYLLADTGMSSYDNRHPSYNWQFFRTESCNSVEVNYTGQSKTGIINVQMYTNPRADFYTGESHTYADFVHTRKVLFVKNAKFFIVSDYITAPDDGKVNTFNQTWHNLIEAKPIMDEETKIAQTTYETGANVEIVPVGIDKLSSATLDDGVGIGEQNQVRNTGPKKHVSYKKEKAGNANFNTVIYPFPGLVTSQIKTSEYQMTDTEDGSASAFSMELPDGNKAKYYVNYRPEKIHRFDWYDVDAGTLYMESDKNDNLKFIAASDLIYVKQDGKNLVSASKKLTDISVSYSGNTANIQSTQEIDLTKDYIRVYAPTSVKVMFNEEEVPFMRIGDDIVIGNFKLELRCTTGPNGEKTAASPALELSYPVELKSGKYWLTLTIQEGTKLTGDAAWDGTISFPNLTETDKEAGDITYGQIPLTELAADTPVRVGFAGKPDWRAALIDGSSLIKPTVELEEDSAEEAKSKLNQEVGFYSSDSGAAVYTKNMKDLLIYSESSSDEPSDGGEGSGGGGGGGGGHLWPEATPTPTVPPTTSPSPSAAPSAKPEFSDISNHWAKEEIDSLVEQGYINGMDDTHFEPDTQMTRAQLAAIVARILELEEQDYQGMFRDVPEDAWYAAVVEAVAEAGIMDGTGDGFLPDKPVTRGELAKIVVGAWRCMGKEVPDAQPVDFTDAAQFAEWEKPFISAAKQLGLMDGMPDGAFYNNKQATRAEAATVLVRFLERAG